MYNKIAWFRAKPFYENLLGNPPHSVKVSCDDGNHFTTENLSKYLFRTCFSNSVLKIWVSKSDDVNCVACP